MSISTIMKVYFNNLGVVSNTDFTNVALRQGSVGLSLNAYFDEIDNALYTATLNFTRSDGTSISGLIMSIDSSNDELYTYKFSDPWFFAKAGTTTMTIYLRDASGNVIAQGQVTFSIEATDYDGDPMISVNQYNELLAAMSGLASNNKTILTFVSLPEETDYEDGQVIYVKSSLSFYQLVSSAWVLKFNCTDHYTKSEIDGFITTLNNSIRAKSSVSGTVDETQHWRTLTIDGVTHNIGGSGGGSRYVAGTGIIVDNMQDTISIDDTVATKDFVNSSIATNTAYFIGTFGSVEKLINIGVLTPYSILKAGSLIKKGSVLNYVNFTEDTTFTSDAMILVTNSSLAFGSVIKSGSTIYTGSWINHIYYESSVVTDADITIETWTNNDYANVINSERNFASTTEMNAFDKLLLTNFDYAWIPNNTKYDLYRFSVETQTWTLQETNIAKTDVSLPTVYNRYTYNGNTNVWTWNYSVNTSGFTAQQWAAINSGITASMVNNFATKSDLQYITTAPVSANTTGMIKIVVLPSEPATKYDGYIYIITGTNA